jgi:homoserine O-succinyltransferase/O-acetyltransferase
MNVLTRSTFRSGPARQRTGVAIGLINNMGDQALKITERQFGSLLSEAAGDIGLSFRIFALKSTRRSPRALDYINARYEPANAAMDGDLDGLIITGAQPQADRLSHESYWEELVELIDWAKLNTVSTILSCLAAHAGVLHLDGVERRPSPEKCTGVFGFTAERTHPLVGKQGRVRRIPHSRYNGLLQSELEQAGYVVLTNSRTSGVDSFVKCFGSQFVFLQGHPEYDANSLAREYRRDMNQYLLGETDRIPARPKGYFGAEAEAKLTAMGCCTAEHLSQQQIQDLSIIDALAPAEALWRGAAVSFFRSWIEMLAIEVNHTSKDGPNPRMDEYFCDNISTDEPSSDLRVPIHSH